jgi:hypothetical protein
MNNGRDRKGRKYKDKKDGARVNEEREEISDGQAS